MGALACLQLANRKIYQESLPPAQNRIVGASFAKHLSLWNPIFLVKMTPHPRSQELESMRTGGHPNPMSTLSVHWPPPPQTHCTHSSWLVGTCSWIHLCNWLNGCKESKNTKFGCRCGGRLMLEKWIKIKNFFNPRTVTLLATFFHFGHSGKT